ncbi:MAG: DNA-binding protein WhiA [Clostridia bacterium]|nr:DNA-binding protein WhiA [Clostridia bacterium]
MSFSAVVKEELSKLNIFNNIEFVKAELFGYLLTSNANYINNKIEFITENQFNIERFYKILFKLDINYEPEIQGKNFKAVISKKNEITKMFENFELFNNKEILRGVFLGSGSITEPGKAYHLEIIFNSKENAEMVKTICELKDIRIKLLKSKEKFYLYLKDGEEISKFLAFIGANKSVLSFEEIRVMKEMKNNINRKVNCETANLNKIVDASLSQIEDIKYLIAKNKFEELSPEVKEVAIARLEHPEEPLKDLAKYLSNFVGKSGINYRLKKIHDYAEELRKEEKYK